MDLLITRNTQNQNVLTELKLSHGHLLDDKEKMAMENATMLASNEQLQNQLAKMEERQRNYESVLQERELLKINITRVEQELQELKPRFAKLQVDYNAVLEYNEELQVKVGDIALERDEMRQLILDQGQESWLADVRKSSVNLTEVRPATPKRSLELLEEHRKRLDHAVGEEDQIDPEMEEKYLSEYEALVAGSRRSVGPDQGEALLAIRKEYFRRELTIAAAVKTIEELEQELEELQIENDELADSIVLQVAYNKELNGYVEEMKHEVSQM